MRASPQDVDRASEASQRALCAVAYWRGEEARLLAKLEHVQKERASAEHNYHLCENARVATCAPEAVRP